MYAFLECIHSYLVVDSILGYIKHYFSLNCCMSITGMSSLLHFIKQNLGDSETLLFGEFGSPPVRDSRILAQLFNEMKYDLRGH